MEGFDKIDRDEASPDKNEVDSAADQEDLPLKDSGLASGFDWLLHANIVSRFAGCIPVLLLLVLSGAREHNKIVAYCSFACGFAAGSIHDLSGLTNTLGLRCRRLCRFNNQQACNSKKLSVLLGSVGAPSIRVDGSELSTDRFNLLLEFVKAQVDLVLQLHETLNILRRGTSLLFGVGSVGLGIERVEKASLARWLRHAQQNDSRIRAPGCMPVSMPTLRKRVNEILTRQIKLLLNLSGDSLACDYSRGSDVLTLSLLSSKKSQIVDLLSSVVDRACTRSLSIDKDFKKQTEECICDAQSSREYLLSATKSTAPVLGSNSQCAPNDLDVIQMLDQVESLRIALLAYHDTASIDQQSSPELWWEKIAKLANSLDSIVRETSARLRVLTSDGDSRDAESDERDVYSLSEVLQEDGVNFSEAEEISDFSARAERASEENESRNKTLVFSGVVAQRKRGKRIIAASVSGTSGGSFPSQFELVDELHERLRALPPADELNVTKDEENRQAAVANEKDPSIALPIAPRDKEKAAFPVGDFLGELKNSVSIAATRAEDDEWLLWDNKIE